MSPPANIQATTLEKFLDAWKAWDVEAWLGIFDANFTQATMPFGMGVPTRKRAEVEQVLPQLMQFVRNYELTIHEVVHDTSKNKAAVYAMSTGDTDFGPWNLEYSTFVTFNGAGDKIARVEEMLDSAFMKEFGPKFGKYLQEKNMH